MNADERPGAGEQPRGERGGKGAPSAPKPRPVREALLERGQRRPPSEDGSKDSRGHGAPLRRGCTPLSAATHPSPWGERGVPPARAPAERPPPSGRPREEGPLRSRTLHSGHREDGLSRCPRPCRHRLEQLLHSHPETQGTRAVAPRCPRRGLWPQGTPRASPP